MCRAASTFENHHINRPTKKSPGSHAEKAFAKTWTHLFMTRTLSELGTEGRFLHWTKHICEKLQLTSSRGDARSCPTKRRNKVPFQVPAKAVRCEQEAQGMQTGMEEIKLSWFTDDRAVYVENPKGLTKSWTLPPAPCGRREESPLPPWQPQALSPRQVARRPASWTPPAGLLQVSTAALSGLACRPV